MEKMIVRALLVALLAMGMFAMFVVSEIYITGNTDTPSENLNQFCWSLEHDAGLRISEDHVVCVDYVYYTREEFNNFIMGE